MFTKSSNPRLAKSAAQPCLLIAVVLLAGCAKPLLSPSEERSPYDRYDAVRNKHAPQYIEDDYGRRQPNLRGRLEPRN